MDMEDHGNGLIANGMTVRTAFTTTFSAASCSLSVAILYCVQEGKELPGADLSKVLPDPSKPVDVVVADASSFPEGFGMTGSEAANGAGLPGMTADSLPLDGAAAPIPPAANGTEGSSGGRGGGGGSARARGQNTQVFAVDGDSVVRLHQTNIVTISASGDVMLSSGGWRTHQTLKGINMSLKNFVPGLQVASEGHVAEGAWRVTNGREWSVPFYDGVTVPGAGPQNLAAQAAQMPGLFEQMSINTAGGYDNSYSTGGGANHGRGGAGAMNRNNRARGGSGRENREGGGSTRAGNTGNGKHQNGSTDARVPLPSQPPPKTDEIPINFEAYDDIPVEASGEDCPAPIQEFTEVALHQQLMKNIEIAKFLKPTPVQRHAIPVGIAKRDLMACAQTGSGKTGAFLFPVLHQMLSEADEADSVLGRVEPRCLILAPTRELATQIFKEAQKFAQFSRIQSVVVYGGSDMRHQIQQLERGCHLLVATPGRLCDLIERGKIGLGKVKHLILDEADRMLDMGFEPQIRRVVEREGMQPTGERQTLMFSATFPKEIQRLASEFMTRYIFVAVGRVGSTTALITQSVVWAEENDKRRVLLEQLASCTGRTIIFVETKRAAEQLEEFLYRSAVPATSIHGDRSQREREQALSGFRRGQPAVLVATDVAARGLDVPDCMHVINFELPRDINSYVHRIGRTGRMGRQGSAISLFGPGNKPVARDLVTLLQEASQITPEWLVKFAAEGSNNVQGRNYNNGQGGGGKGKFGGRDFRQNAQVRQYRHSAASAPPAGYEQANGQRMPNAQMPGGWPQQGYLAGIQHKQPGMYGQGMPGAAGVQQMPNADPNGWVAGGWQQMGMGGMQQMPPASSVA